MHIYRPRHWSPRRRPDDNRPGAADRGYSGGWKAARDRVMSEERVCALCGRPGADSDVVDHIRPLNQGGTHRRDNLQRVCRRCNAAKAVIQNSSRRPRENPNLRRNGVML